MARIKLRELTDARVANIHPTFIEFLTRVEDLCGVLEYNSIERDKATQPPEASKHSLHLFDRASGKLCCAADIETKHKDYKRHTEIMTALLSAALLMNLAHHLGIELVDEPSDSHIHVDLKLYPDHPFKRPYIWRSAR